MNQNNSCGKLNQTDQKMQKEKKIKQTQMQKHPKLTKYKLNGLSKKKERNPDAETAQINDRWSKVCTLGLRESTVTAGEEVGAIEEEEEEGESITEVDDKKRDW